MKKVEIIIKDTHRGLWYEDGVLTKVLEAGRYEIPNREGVFGRKGPLVELVLVDMRERDLTMALLELPAASAGTRLVATGLRQRTDGRARGRCLRGPSGEQRDDPVDRHVPELPHDLAEGLHLLVRDGALLTASESDIAREASDAHRRLIERAEALA